MLPQNALKRLSSCETDCSFVRPEKQTTKQ